MIETEKNFKPYSIGKLNPSYESNLMPVKWDLSGLITSWGSVWDFPLGKLAPIGSRQGKQPGNAPSMDEFDFLDDQEIDPDYRQWCAY